MSRLALSALLLAIVVVWGWTFTVVKDAVAVYGVVPFLAVRFVIGSLCIGPFAARRVDRRALRVGGLIGIVLASAYLFQTFGLHDTTPTNAGMITGLFIVFAPLANRVLFRVRTNRVLWAAIGTSVLGLALLTGAGREGPALGDLLTLGGAACFGLHIALLDRYSKEHDASSLALGQLTAASILFLAICPLSEPLAWPTSGVWFALLITGVIATAAGSYVQTFVQQRLSAVETAVIIVTEPLFAALFGYWLADDRLTLVQILGAALMIGAVFVAEIFPLLRNAERSVS